MAIGRIKRRRTRSIYVTDEEFLMVKKYLDTLRIGEEVEERRAEGESYEAKRRVSGT